MTIDATNAYSDTGTTRVRRLFVLVREEAIVVLDDIAAGFARNRIDIRLASGRTAEFVKTDAGWKLVESQR